MAKASRKNAASARFAIAPEPSGPAADSMDRVLRAVRSHLGMDVCFVSEFVAGRRVFRHVDTSAGEGPVQVGASSPLDEGYCQRVVDGRLPELIPDTAANPVAMALPVTRAVPVGGPAYAKSGITYTGAGRRTDARRGVSDLVQEPPPVTISVQV